MYEEEIHFGNCYLKQSDTVLKHLTQCYSATQDGCVDKV